MKKKVLFKSSLVLAFVLLASMFGFSKAFGYGGGGGGGVFSVAPCSVVTYGDWGECINGFQYRNVTSQTPYGCSLTTSQQLDRSRVCGTEEAVAEEEVVASTLDSVSELINVQEVMQTERSLVTSVNAQLTNRLVGRILLQVENHGQAWYLEPTGKERHFMGRPNDAFDMMRRFGLGISEVNFNKFQEDGVPARFAGRIFLRTEANGEAYYINPVDMQMNYLGRPADAFRIMRELALGINNTNIRQIQVAEVE